MAELMLMIGVGVVGMAAIAAATVADELRRRDEVRRHPLIAGGSVEIRD